MKKLMGCVLGALLATSLVHAADVEKAKKEALPIFTRI